MSAVEASLGRIAHPPVTAPDAASDATPDIDPAFRAVMFTDIVGSTEMTARLGDARAVEMVRAHDGVVREAVRSEQGREVKHTGDGLMISFDDVDAAVRCARSTMRALNDFNASVCDSLSQIFAPTELGTYDLKGFDDSVSLFEVAWR